MTPEQKKKANARNKAWKNKSENREKVKQRKHDHYMENRAKYLTSERDRQYRKRYGITLADYNRMLSGQDGKCAICRSETSGNVGQCFAVDHDHATGYVRGLLCIKCNARLGWLEARLGSVLEYLSKYKAATGVKD